MATEGIRTGNIVCMSVKESVLDTPSLLLGAGAADFVGNEATLPEPVRLIERQYVTRSPVLLCQPAIGPFDKLARSRWPVNDVLGDLETYFRRFVESEPQQSLGGDGQSVKC